MTTTAATSMISKNSTTAASLVGRDCRWLAGAALHYRAERELAHQTSGNRRAHAHVRRQGRQATLTSTSWMPAPDGATLASPLPAGDRARSVHVPGAAKNRKSPVAEATTSAVNSSVESSSRTNAPPTSWPAPATTRPVITVSFSRSTPAGNVRPCFGAEHISTSQLDRGSNERAVFRPTSVVVLDVLVSQQLLQHEPRVRRALADSAVRNGLLLAVEAGL